MEGGMRFNTFPGCLTFIELGVEGVYAFAMLHIAVCNSQNGSCTPVCCHVLFEIRGRDIIRDKFETLFFNRGDKITFALRNSQILSTTEYITYS